MSANLQSAIDANDAEQTRAALAELPDKNAKLFDGLSPMQYAAKVGSNKSLAAILDAGIKPKASHRHPFIFACEGQHIPAMQLLVSRKMAPPTTVSSAMSGAISKGHNEVARFLLQQAKAKLKIMHLVAALEKGNLEGARMLADAGLNMNEPIEGTHSKGKFTAMHLCVKNGNPEGIRLLIEHGANHNARDHRGATPLMVFAGHVWLMLPPTDDWAQFRKALVLIANKNGALESPKPEPEATLRELLNSGADATLKDDHGNDALDYYQFTCRRRNDSPEDPKIIEILKNAGAQDSDATLELHFANDVAAVQKAIAAGADVNRIPPMHGLSALGKAASDGNIELIKVLLEAGADINKADWEGRPLIHAAYHNKLPAVKFLVEAGADLFAIQPTAPSELGPMNAFQVAQWLRIKDVKDYLKSVGGDKAPKWKPIEAGVHYWEDFRELLAKGDVATVAAGLASIINGSVHLNAAGKKFKAGEVSYVVARPKGLSWSNIIQIRPVPRRSDKLGKLSEFCKSLAAAAAVSTLMIQYSDTSVAAEVHGFEPSGKTWKDDGWDQPMLEELIGFLGPEAPAWAKKRLATIEAAEEGSKQRMSSSDRLIALATEENFAVGAVSLADYNEDPVEIAFAGHPPEAFDDVAFVGPHS